MAIMSDEDKLVQGKHIDFYALHELDVPLYTPALPLQQ